MLTQLQFGSNKIRFENRDGRVWVSLTDMAKASGKQIGHWNKLKSTTDFLSAFESVIGIPITKTTQGGISQGTWAIEEVAIEFAGWCSVSFKIWTLQQIKTLMNEGSVSLKPKTALELAKEQVKLLEQIEIQNQIIADQEKDLLRQSEVIDELFNYSSIIRIAKFNNCSEKSFSWRFLKAVSQQLNLEIKKVPCPRFEYKLLYSHDVWRYAYPNCSLPETVTLRIVA